MLLRMAVKVVNIGKGLAASSTPATKVEKKILTLMRFQNLQLAAEAVQSGEVIAVPTDTIYGLAALVQVKTMMILSSSSVEFGLVYPQIVFFFNFLNYHFFYTFFDTFGHPKVLLKIYIR